MKENSHSTQDIDHCPLCCGDEFLLSDSGSLLCGQCGSFFENVYKVVATESFQPKSLTFITQPQSMWAH